MSEANSNVASKTDLATVKLIRIEERCYRCFGIPELSNDNNGPLTPRIDQSNSPKDSNVNEDTTFIDVKIEQAGRCGYKHSFSVPNAFYGLIIGPRGETLKNLERVTKTAIRIPNSNVKVGDVVITGARLEEILTARHRIDILMETSRNKLKPTHFISIPMTDKTITSNFEEFKSQALNVTGKDSTGVREVIFQKPEKMHLTFGVLIFIDDDELKAGVEAFQQCKEEIIMPIIKKHGSIKIKAQGVGCFGDAYPGKLSVLYGTVSSENDALQELADKMAEFFLEKGMMKKEVRDKVNLHMTLMNSSFGIDRKSSYRQTFQKFDARNIIEAQKDHLFGEITLSEIHLCSLGGPKTEDGYYEITSKINVNE